MPAPAVPPRVRRPTDRRTARADGITDWHLRHRETVRSSRDAYLPADAAADLVGRITAVLLGAPPGAVVSHRTAADLWNLEIPLVAPDPRIHLTVPMRRRVRSRADRHIHVGSVSADHQAVRRGCCVTTLGRTWLDLAASLGPAPLLAAADQLLGRGVPREALDELLDQASGHRGVRTARVVLPLADPKAGSPQESVLRWILHEAGVPRPVLRHAVLDAAGEKVGEVDLAWPAQRVLVEFDGDVHRDRRTFVDDLRRQNGLVLAGWTVLRFTSADLLGRPQWVVATIRAALSAA